MSKRNHISRRRFMGQTGCGAMASTTLFSTLLNLKALGAAAMSDSSVIGSGDYKAMVCIYLGGGNDSYNMLMPTQADGGSMSEYNAYAGIRNEIAIPHAAMTAVNPISGANTILNPLNTGSRNFGLHPSMPRLAQLFNSGKAAFVSNVGTLIEPLTVNEFWNESKRVPLGLLSHSDQTQQWMTALPHERAGIGWGGRISDMVNDMNTNPSLAMGISMAGTNIFQTGGSTNSYSMNGYASILNEDGTPNTPLRGIFGYDDDWALMQTRTGAIDNMLDKTYSDIYENTYANLTKGGRDGWKAFDSAMRNTQMNTSFRGGVEGSYFETNSLGWVAKMIGAREELGYKRQTFFVSMGGWDHHDEVLDAQEAGLNEVDFAINQFQEALKEDGIDAEDCVVTFLISDFARTLGSNGNGTDHAWGGNMAVVGGPVKGQRIYGTYPETLDPSNNDYDLGGGIVMPTTSADVYFAEIAE
ncbi:MAG: hypothetical protein ACI9FN_002671, partial [Saprospiraceae bacterium]